MRRTFYMLTTAGCLLLAACGSTSPASSADRSTSESTPLSAPVSAPVSIEDDPNNVTIDFGANKTPQPYDEFLQTAVADIQDYWRETYPATYGAPYTELQGGIWAGYPDRAEPMPDGCPGEAGEAYVGVGNAFHCGNGDYIVYDDADLVPQIAKSFGNSAVGVIFAHEFGHAIQYRAQVLQDAPTVFSEQQADCFAGAWTAHVARGESARLTFSDDDVKAGLSAMVDVKDGDLGGDVFAGDAHGTAFDRVGAFENGFKGGAAACKAMETDPLPLLNLHFGTQDEADSGGNLPYAEIVPDAETDLTRYWTATVEPFSAPTITSYPHSGPFPSCPGIDESQYPGSALYCPATNEIVFDDAYATDLYNRFGDYAVYYIISNAWSEAVQTQIGDGLQGAAREAIDDCLTGAWTQDGIPPADGTTDDTRSYVSPGDLDEAVETALLSDAPSEDTNVASAFDKIDNFRAGVLGGITECQSRMNAG